MTEQWTIEQLAPLVEMALDVSGYDGQPSARVRSLPDLRTIRYYTTLGLLDPPAEMRGRKAFYARRHLVQLVAVKRLQARGLSLGQVQQALAGMDDGGLAELASLPAGFWDRVAALPIEAVKKPATPPAPARLFWAGETEAAVHDTSRSGGKRPTVSDGETLPRLALHLPVIDGVQLVFEGIDPARWTPDTIARLKGPLEALAQTLRDLN